MDIDKVMSAVTAAFPVITGASDIAITYSLNSISWTATFDVYIGSGGTCGEALNALVADMQAKSGVRRDDAAALITKLSDLHAALASVLV